MQTGRPIEWMRSAVDDESSSLDVAIVYDDFPAGQSAIRTLAPVEKNLENQLTWRLQIWRSDFLQDPDGFTLALKDGIQADILVIALSGELTDSLKRWIEHWLARKRGARVAIVALFGARQAPNALNSKRLQFVQCAAKDAGVDFFTTQLLESHPVEKE